MGRVDGKVVFLTGLGSAGPGWGNGKASAVLYAREGAAVFGIDTNMDAANETVAAIEKEGGRCRAFCADVTSASDIKAAVAACVAAYGRVDVLHNNVGIGGLGGPVELGEAESDRIFKINYGSIYKTCAEILPIMLDQKKGSIINTASIAAIRWLGYPFGAYSASKAAVIALTQNMALQYAPRHIRVNCIVPGLMNTPLVKEAMKGAYGERDFDEMIRTRHAQCPMGHMGDAWDIAYAALYLASDESKYVTGLPLIVDGGFTLRAA